MQTERDIALSKAKIALMARPDSVFFTTLCFSLKHEWDETIQTACTNGKYIKYSPKYLMSLDKEERVFILLHETLHVAYLHMLRVGTKIFKKWNYATDYVINLQLVERGFKMPKGLLFDTKWKGMSAEEVYAALPDDIDMSMPMDLEPGVDTQEEEITREVQDILVRASVASKQAGDKPGTIPGDIQLYLDNLLKPKLKWNQLLRKYLHSFAKSDYSFKTPNRRFFPKYHMPSLRGESLINLSIAVDISGSVSDHEFKVFVSEVASILRMMKPEKITLIQFDTSIKSVTEIRNLNDLMNCQFTGRGGTYITPVIEWAKENNPQLLMVFSDGGFRFYDQEFKRDTLWFIHNNPGFTAPFGKVIHYEIQE